MRGLLSIPSEPLPGGQLARKSFLNLKDRDGQTALSYASMLGRPSMCRMLLKEGTSVDLADKRGWSPAVWATKKGHKEVTQLLLDNGALSPRSAKASGRIMQLARRLESALETEEKTFGNEQQFVRVSAPLGRGGA